MARRRKRYLDNAAPADNTANVIRPVIVRRDENIKARSPERQRVEQQKARDIAERNQRISSTFARTPAGRRAANRAYAVESQRQKQEAAKEEAAAVVGSLFKPLMPSTYVDMAAAIKNGQVDNLTDALVAPYLSDSWSMRNPGKALAIDIVTPFAVGKGVQLVDRGTKGLRLARVMNKSLINSNIENLNNTLNIIGSEVTNPYASPLENSKDIIQKYIASKAIRGEDVPGFSGGQVVKFGDDEAALNYLLHNTVGRNRLAVEKAINEGGTRFTPSDLADWERRVNRNINRLKDIRVGMYPGSWYEAAGEEHLGGFITNDNIPFISINTDSKFPINKVKQHEGLHFMDANDVGNDFWTLDQRMMLGDAYDGDFLDLPDAFNAGDLKGYKHMDKERWTTNADARGLILDKPHLRGLSIDLQNKILDKLTDEQIVDAVFKSNGYGQRYIEWLNAKDKLTPQKINAFRQAMKYVGGYSIPLGVGYGIYKNQ